MRRLIVAAGLVAALVACQAAPQPGNVADDWRDCRLESEGEDAQLVFDSCSRVIEQSADSYRVATAYNNRSIVLVYWGRYAEAVDDTNQAIGLRPNRSSAYHNRGRAYSMWGKADLASADFEEALRLNPENAWAYNSYAWHLAQQGDYAASDAQIAKAIALKPESPLLVDTRAHVLMGLGEVSAAQNAFARAMELGGPGIVREYQESLIAKGYTPSRSDGVMDDATQAALRACIRDNCRLLLD